jgi:hypothetical protein
MKFVSRTIYKVTSPSGKMYIGKTFNFNERKKQHIKVSFEKSSKEYNLPFHSAIRKYSPQHMLWEILEEGIGNEEDLKQREIWWIKRFGTWISARQCAKDLSCDSSGISCCLRGERKCHKNYIFKPKQEKG